jgi:hypothetical protein
LFTSGSSTIQIRERQAHCQAKADEAIAGSVLQADSSDEFGVSFDFDALLPTRGRY